jgi:hypothetical protein
MSKPSLRLQRDATSRELSAALRSPFSQNSQSVAALDARLRRLNAAILDEVSVARSTGAPECRALPSASAFRLGRRALPAQRAQDRGARRPPDSGSEVLQAVRDDCAAREKALTRALRSGDDGNAAAQVTLLRDAFSRAQPGVSTALSLWLLSDEGGRHEDRNTQTRARGDASNAELMGTPFGVPPLIAEHAAGGTASDHRVYPELLPRRVHSAPALRPPRDQTLLPPQLHSPLRWAPPHRAPAPAPRRSPLRPPPVFGALR